MLWILLVWLAGQLAVVALAVVRYRRACARSEADADYGDDLVVWQGWVELEDGPQSGIPH